MADIELAKESVRRYAATHPQPIVYIFFSTTWGKWCPVLRYRKPRLDYIGHGSHDLADVVKTQRELFGNAKLPIRIGPAQGDGKYTVGKWGLPVPY